MSYELSVVAPCYNEAGNIYELTDRLLKTFEKHQIAGQVILVNDGSIDATASEIDDVVAKNEHVYGYHHPSNLGMEAGWITGVTASQGRYVCLIDADLQNLPEDVPRLYREILHSRVDIVQGYRSAIGRLRGSRLILSKTLNAILNATFGMRLRDNKSGFVIGLKDTMEDVLRHRYRYRYFQSFILVAAASKGYSIQEVETLFESRLAGDSFIPRVPLSLLAKVSVDLVKAFVEYRLNKKDETILGHFLKTNRPSKKDEEIRGWRKALWNIHFATMPFHKWMLTRRTKTYYEELKQSQWLSLEQIRQLQNAKLRRLIHHAYHHVAYYRLAMDDLGLKPSDIQTVADLAKLPLLDKQTVRENIYFDLLSDNHNKRKMLKVTTSGSTGEPFFCYADRHQLEIRWATTLRAMEWTGYRFGDPQARLWHQTIGMSKTQQLRERLDALLNRRMFIPAYEMTDANMPKVIEKLKKHQPTLVDGYAESFNFIAHYLKENPVEGFDISGIVSSAQVLPEQSRKVIEESFGCGVYDKYGSREFSGIAYECDAHDGHHIMSESYFVELLVDGRPAKPGEMGEVVITDLNNLSMPMIRYRIGDLAVAMDPEEPCSCGRGLPRLGKIEGRVQSIIFAANGAYLPGSLFPHLFKDYDYLIRQYQVIQEKKGEIILKIIKGSRFTESGFAGVMDELRKYLGEDTLIDVQFVDEIPMVRTGKQQESVSRIPIDFQRIRNNA